jgi:hypothetical protein
MCSILPPNKVYHQNLLTPLLVQNGYQISRQEEIKKSGGEDLIYHSLDSII